MRRIAPLPLWLCLALASAAAAQNPLAQQQERNRAGLARVEGRDLQVYLCGTSGPLFAPDRAGPCTAVFADGRLFVVDAGAGALAGINRAALPVSRLTALLLTHLHSDHIAEVGEINFARWAAGDGGTPLEVWGPEGVDRVVNGFMTAYELDRGYREAHHTAAIFPPAGSVAQARTLPVPTDSGRSVVYDEGGLVVTAFLVDHPPIVPSLGYRFDFGGRSVVVSGDTKRSDNLVEVARGADLLVHEAIADGVISMMTPALRSAGNERGATILTDALDNHTFPADLFALAAAAEVRAVVVSHLVPPLPAAQAERAFTQGRDAFAGEVTVGEDGMLFILPPGSDEIRRETLGP